MSNDGLVSKLEQILGYLSNEFDGYPYCKEKEQKYFNRLINEFTDIDLFDELKQFHAWTLDQSDDKKIYYRSRFRSWLKTARDFKIIKTAILPKSPDWVRRRYAASRY
jgi:hypothetical protein